MKMRIFVTAVLALAMIAGLFIGLPSRALAQTPGVPTGPWADRLVWSEQTNAGLALEQIKSGEGDFFMFSLQGGAQKVDAFQSADVQTSSTYGSVNALLMNPNRQLQDDIPGGEAMNPFTDAQIRQAMQWIVDRNLLNLEVLEGFASSFVVPFHPKNQDYFREIETFQNLETEYQGDFARGQAQIEARMTALGASISVVDNTWHDAFGDQIVITILARIEDERLQIGQYVGDQLERLGFAVNVLPTPGSQAIPRVYGGAPDDGGWLIYTEGWAFTQNVAWDDGQLWVYHDCQFEPFCASQNPGVGTFIPDATFDQMSEDLAFGAYTSLAERQQLVRDLTPQTLSTHNYRMWIQAEQAVFPVSSRIQGAAFDAFGGPWTPFTLKSAKLIPGQPGVSGTTGVGGDIRVLNFIMFNDAWSPYQNDPWLYDSIQRGAMGDPGMALHPNTGLYIDYRVTTAVQTAGPTGTMTVPATALYWDVDFDVNGDVTRFGNGFRQVGAGVTAITKVTTSLGTNMGKWHTGADINMDDVIYGIASAFRRAYGDLIPHDPLSASPSEQFYYQNILKGVEFDPVANTVTAYIDYWHVDTGQMAANGYFYMGGQEVNGGAPVPWEIQEAILQSVLDDRTAIDQTTATGKGVPQVDLGRDPSSIGAIDDAFATIRTANRIPMGMDNVPVLGAVITPAEATARYAASQAFRTSYGHWYASNGPYILQSINPTFKQTVMVAFRNGYPFSADHWDFLKTPQVPAASFGSFPASMLAGTTAILDVTTTQGGAPADPKAVRWFVRQLSTGAVAIRGDAVRAATGDYEVQLLSTQTTGLQTGGYELVVVIQGDQGAITQTFAFSVTSQIDFFSALLSEVENRLDTQAEQLTDLGNSVANVQTSASSLGTLMTAVIALALIAIVVPAVLMFVILGRMKKPSSGMGKDESPPDL
jgi:peptide/nickel transport system substrate-binding protein